MLAMLVQVLAVLPPRVQQYGSVLAITAELSHVSEANLTVLLLLLLLFLFFFFPLMLFIRACCACATLCMHITPEVQSYGGL